MSLSSSNASKVTSLTNEGKYVILNNSSSFGPEGNYIYEFWFLRKLLKLIGDKPFSRGDIAKIAEINEQMQYIKIDVIGDPSQEEVRNSAPPINQIPALLFLSSKIYLNENSEYVLDADDNVEIILSYTSLLDGNKAYAAAVTMFGDYARVTGYDERTGISFEWLLENRGVKI